MRRLVLADLLARLLHGRSGGSRRVSGFLLGIAQEAVLREEADGVADGRVEERRGDGGRHIGRCRSRVRRRLARGGRGEGESRERAGGRVDRVERPSALLEQPEDSVRSARLRHGALCAGVAESAACETLISLPVDRAEGAAEVQVRRPTPRARARSSTSRPSASTPSALSTAETSPAALRRGGRGGLLASSRRGWRNGHGLGRLLSAATGSRVQARVHDGQARPSDCCESSKRATKPQLRAGKHRLGRLARPQPRY